MVGRAVVAIASTLFYSGFLEFLWCTAITCLPLELLSLWRHIVLARFSSSGEEERHETSRVGSLVRRFRGLGVF